MLSWKNEGHGFGNCLPRNYKKSHAWHLQQQNACGAAHRSEVDITTTGVKTGPLSWALKFIPGAGGTPIRV